ncbi:MAG: RDD family protein [Pseudomonadota bacterium]
MTDAARPSVTVKGARQTSGPRLIEDFVPPEGVPLHFGVARLGTRFGSQIIDLLITGGLCIALILVLALSNSVTGTTLSAVSALLFFFIRTPYYAAAELVWNGQTLGKRLSRIRVISGNGRSLTPYQIVVRNLMREVEVFVPGTMLIVVSELDVIELALLLGWIAVVIAIPLFNRRRQRLGDIIANTYVIRLPEAVLLPDLSLSKSATPSTERPRYVFLPNQLDHYGAYELQVLEKVLQSRPSGGEGMLKRRRDDLRAIGDRIRRKINFGDPVDPDDEEAFLTTFYAAQREYLEKKQLFGEVREDKYHAER